MKLIASLLWLFLVFISGCGQNESVSLNSDLQNNNKMSIGSYLLHYDPSTTSITIASTASAAAVNGKLAPYPLSNVDTTGGPACAIYDTLSGQCYGLISPRSCDIVFDPVLMRLSFRTGITNISNITGPNIVYTDPSRFPPNTTFYRDVEFKITEFSWDPIHNPGFIDLVNTDIDHSECGRNGLSLANDDLNGNFIYDCLVPDQPMTPRDHGDAGWEYEHLIPIQAGVPTFAPGDSTGCGGPMSNGKYMEITLLANNPFTIHFDIQAYRN